MTPIVITKRVGRRGDPAGDLAWQINKGLLGVTVAREFKFHVTRRWAVDLIVCPGQIEMLALKEFRPLCIAIEIEGGFFLKGGGRHNRGSGARADCVKYSELAIAGFRLLRVLPEWVNSGVAFSLVERAVKGTK
jgi:hypothetical protein